MTALLPCPFCGNTPKLCGSDNDKLLVGWFVECDDCGASQKITAGSDSGARAIEAWNRRAPPAIAPETGTASPQGASAITSETVPLSDDELLAMWSGGDERFMRPVLGSKKVLAYARAVEQAVRAKLLLNETGYAGVKVWVGDKQVVRIVSEAELQHEVVPGRALVNAAIQTIAAVQEAHVDN